MSMKNRVCALCKSEILVPVIDLGFHPCADTFVLEDRLSDIERHFPLKVCLCESCGHTQLAYVVSGQERYQDTDYSYDSSNSQVSIEHFRELALDVVQRVGIKSSDIVCDIGSNIGTLLEAFKRNTQCVVIGVDPSKNLANLANEAGIFTINNFFNQESAREILRHGRPKVITATNVFNHSEDVEGFIENVKYLLDPNGYLVIEVPYLLEMIRQTAFDTIYLEHINYFSVTPLVKFFAKHSFGIEWIEVSDYMCGTIRIYARPNIKNAELVSDYMKSEDEFQLFSHVVYEEFMNRVRRLKFRLNKQLYEIKAAGGKIIGIGAATKGNTLLNYCKIDSDLIECISDASILKMGKITPGSHIKIISDEDIPSNITHGLILPWNIANFLKVKLAYLNLTFIIPNLEVE